MAERKRSFDRAQDERSFDKLRMSGEDDQPRIIPNKNRRLQVAPTSRKLFDEAAKDEFLEWFAATANCSLSARKTGFHYRTVIRHWREDEAFGERCEAALRMGYPRLEELALRAAEVALERAAAKTIKGDREPPVEHFRMDATTALQLLREHQRHLAGLAGGSGAWAKPGRPPKRVSFEEAMGQLDKRLRSLGLRHGIPADWEPPSQADGRAEPAEGAPPEGEA